MADSRPNLLLIILDTLRRDRLSIYGNARPTSPHFDAFAADHALFERAVAPAQWTIPAHGSLFTGLYPGAHGLTQANGTLNGLNPTLAEILAASGYHTTAFCNNPLVGVLDNGLQRGFDHFFHYASAIPERPFNTTQSRLKRDFITWFRPYARRIGNSFAHSDTLFRIALNPLFVPVWTRYINFKGHTSDSISDLIAYWKQHHAGGRERPLFSFVNLMGAHMPYQPPQDYVDKIAPELRRDKRAYQFIRRFNADGAGWASPREHPLDDWERHTLDAFYEAEIAYQDEQLGRLLDFLKTSGALANTAVVIAADHGELHGEHDFFGHGFSVHQELVHVPMTMHLPDLPAQRVGATVSTRRLFHTFLDLAHATPPLDAADPNADVRGLSLVDVLDHGTDGEGGSAFSEAVAPMTFVHVLEHRSPAVIAKLHLLDTRRTVYEGAFKLMMRGDQVEGLYDTAQDPDELHNLAHDPAHAAQIAALKRRITPLIDGAAAHNGTAEVSDQVIDQLRALGYMD
ncbi:MAG: sulfatase [bacterium]|nr:sulfatase [bacterium]